MTHSSQGLVSKDKDRYEQLEFEFGPEWIKENVRLPEPDANGDIVLPPIEFPDWALGEDGQTHGRQQQP
jgi:hypothetical protein